MMNYHDQLTFGFWTIFYNRVIGKGIHGQNKKYNRSQEELDEFAATCIADGKIPEALKDILRNYAAKYKDSPAASSRFKDVLPGEWKMEVITAHIHQNFERAFRNLETICANL